MNRLKSAEIIINTIDSEGLPETLKFTLRSKHILEKLQGRRSVEAVGVILNRRNTVEAESEIGAKGAKEFIKKIESGEIV